MSNCKSRSVMRILFIELLLISFIASVFPSLQAWGQAKTIKIPIKKPAPAPAEKADKKAGARPTTGSPAPLAQIIPAPKKAVDFEFEMRRLNSLVKRNNKNADAFFNRGWLYAYKGALQMAFKDYTKAIEINKEHRDAYYNRGLVSVRMKRYAQAAKDFSEAIRLEPKAVDAYCNRGNAHFQLGKMNLALRDYNAALRISPNDADLYYNRGLVHSARGDKPKAMVDFRKAAQAGHAKAKEYLRLSPSKP
ncbi:MAG: tetratricopeptide repeat protein [Desulfobacteraceae bacterium]